MFSLIPAATRSSPALAKSWQRFLASFLGIRASRSRLKVTPAAWAAMTSINNLPNAAPIPCVIFWPSRPCPLLPSPHAASAKHSRSLRTTLPTAASAIAAWNSSSTATPSAARRTPPRPTPPARSGRLPHREGHVATLGDAEGIRNMYSHGITVYLTESERRRLTFFNQLGD